MSPYFTNSDEEIRRLRSDLYMARHTILELMPEQIRTVLDTYHGCKSHEEALNWEQEAVDKLLAAAQPKPAREMGEYSSFSDRAYCPLCGGSAQNVYGGEGYAFPEGLRRHIEGSYNAHVCPVFEAIRGLCREAVRMEQERQKRARLAEQRSNKPLKGMHLKRRAP